ncbi:MAG: M1 family aminopeptidase [Burkholderiales bacterium]
MNVRSLRARTARWIVAACAAVAFVAPTFAQAPSIPVPGLRLPRIVVPLAYDAKLKVDPNQETFGGTIDITVRLLEPSDLIWLNAKKLAIASARALVLASPDDDMAATVVGGSDDVVGLSFAKALPAGEARLTIVYTGGVDSTGAVGLFRQREADRWYAFTDSEPMDARRIYPCFDEPDRKAPWKLTVTIPEATRAFSNMPIEGERPAAPGWREVSFQRTPPLPTYLVAFAVGEFDVRDAGRAGQNATPISIVTPKGRAADAAFAAANTGAILAATERYFGRPYPFPKLDFVSYPRGTRNGAMENPGLVTFSARILLARPDEVTPPFEQRFTGTAAHEIAHMWFGNYVTMAWWDDLWLNESFASWLGTYVTGEVRPDWPRGGWRSRQRTRAMESDRLASARAMRQPITAFADVQQAFDGIAYAKGESVLAMFEQWVGPEKFRGGVRTYIGSHAWGTATSDDFFAALATADEALVPAFRGFVERPGVPLLDVALDCTGAPSLKLSQQRFVVAGADGKPAGPWMFPACFDFGDAAKGRQMCTLVRDPSQVVPLPTTACPQWVVANRSGIGYYLPRLTPALYAAMPKAERALPAADFDAILSDLSMLAQGGAVGFVDVLPLAVRQSGSVDARAARRAYDLAAAVPRAMVDAANEGRYAAYIRHNFGDRARSLGWTPRAGESPDVLRLREAAVPLVADRGQDAALARKAVQLAQRWLTHRSALRPDARRIVLIGAARGAGRDASRLFDALAVVAKTSKDPNERDDALVALVSFRDPASLSRGLALLLDPQFSGIEVSWPLQRALDDAATRPVAVAWLATNIDAMAARVPREAQRYWPTAAAGACTAAERAQFVALFEARAADPEVGVRSYREALETIDGCLALRRAQQIRFNAFLAGLK